VIGAAPLKTIPCQGVTGAAFSRRIGLWWGESLTSLREHAAPSGGGSSR
jgi:hypothetical protein